MNVPQTKKKEQPRPRGASAATARSYAEGAAALEFAANYGLIQEALDSLDQGLAIYDGELRLVVWNRRFLDLLDYPRELARPGTELSEFIRVNAARGDYGPGDIDDLVRQRCEMVRRKKKHWSFERVRPNGRTIEICHNALPDGGMVSTYLDITARKTDEEVLRRQAVVMEQLNEAVIVINRDPVITECNDAAARIFGCRREDLIGQPPISMMADTNAWKEIRGDIVKNLDASNEWVGEVEMRRRGGLTFLAELVMAPSFDHDGKRSGAIGIIRDITEKNKAEKELRHQALLMEQLKEAVIVVDLERRITHCNLAAENMFGYEREYLLGETADMLVADADVWREQLDGMMQLVLNGDSWTGETKYRRKDGTVLIGELTLTPLLDPGGEAISLIGVIRDMTERSESMAELRREKEKAEIANRAKTEFLANMSHELRTPLNAIIGFSKMMQDRLFGDLGAPQYQEYATSIHDSGAHLLGIINDILDLSKIEAGKFELDEYPIEIGAVIEWCLNTVKARAQEARQKLTTDLPDCLPALMGDERVIRQVILNLLSNSVKFTPEEGTIDIRVTHDDEGLAITVSDTGIGIPKDKLEHVFNPFGQADGTLSRQHGGTGLGLSITKSLVEMHDGTIDLQSEVDAGTSVTLKFPSHRLAREDSSAS